MDKFINSLCPVPYVEHGNSLYGMDCFGLVEYWHKENFGIEIADRTKNDSNPDGFFNGYKDQKDWVRLDSPQDHCVVVMRTTFKKQVFEYGHCGMYFNGHVAHFERGQGFCFEPWESRFISSRCTFLGIHKHVNN